MANSSCSHYDDFWPEPTDCLISESLRQDVLLILLICSSLNVLLAGIKVWQQKPFDQWPLTRPQRASLLVGCHYLSNVALVGILLGWNCRILECAGSVFVTAISVWWGCLSHSLRLSDILVVALRTQGISGFRYQKWTQALRKLVITASCLGAVIWLICSSCVYWDWQAEVMFQGMWLS